MSNVPSIFVDGNYVYAGADSVIYISIDYGKSWTQSSRISEDVDFVSALTKYNNRIYVGTYNHGIFVSTDEGKTWMSANNGLTGLGAKTISDFVVDGDNLYAGTYGAGIFVMDLKNSIQWNSFNEGIPSLISFNVQSLLKRNNILYAGAGGNGSFYMNDGLSNQWKEVQFGNLQGQPLMFFDMIHVGSSIIISSSYGLHRSTDGGKSFSYFSPGVGYIAISNFAVYGNKIYVNFSKGAGRTFWFTSSDNGETWQLFQDQLGVDVLNITVINDKLFAGRLDGLWYMPLTPTGIDDGVVPVNYMLNQNYPNPFNPSTKISYSIPTNGFVTLAVYDILGRKIATLVNEEKPAGNYEVTFDMSYVEQGRSMASGVYFYRLSCGNFTATKKFVLSK